MDEGRGPNNPCFEIGARVEVDGYLGTVRYYGELSSTSGLWLGVEWDNPERGKHDGLHENRRYFCTKNPKSASFIRPKKANTGITFLSAISSRYGKNAENCLDEMQDENIHVQIVGVQKFLDKHSLQKLVHVHVPSMSIYGLGKDVIDELFPALINLDLSGNLLPSWESVANITKYLPSLSNLLLSYNRLRLSEDHLSLRSAFCFVTFLCLNHMDYNWSEIAQCLESFTHLSELSVSFNKISDISHVTASMQSLKVFHLSGNPITNWQSILSIGSLPLLEEFYLTDSHISSISFPDTATGQITALFPSLKKLLISNNDISDWVSVGELNKLANLTDLIITKNPVFTSMPEMDAFAMVLAKLPRIKTLNKRKYAASERRDAEIDYLKKYTNDWRLSGGNEDPNLNKPSEDFLQQHPTYELLVQRYGAVQSSEVALQSKRIQTISVTIESPLIEGKPPISKKLPLNMTVQKLKLLLQKLYDNKIKPWKMILYYRSTKMPEFDIPLDHDLRDLYHFSVEDGDAIIVRWR